MLNILYSYLRDCYLISVLQRRFLFILRMINTSQTTFLLVSVLLWMFLEQIAQINKNITLNMKHEMQILIDIIIHSMIVCIPSAFLSWETKDHKRDGEDSCADRKSPF